MVWPERDERSASVGPRVNARIAGETCLIVPVPAAEGAVAGHRARLDPSAADGAPAHITLLAPFLPLQVVGGEDQSWLRRLFAASDPIHFSLARVARFAGVLFLAPEPGEPFTALTEAIWRRWPQCPPYEGAYDEVVPHLTEAVGEGAFAGVEREVAPLLPIGAIAEEVWLIARGEDCSWVREQTFPLGA